MSQSLTFNSQVVQAAALSVPVLDQDLNNIQKLDDEPNDTGGLTAAQLKAEFDRAGNTIASYLNDQLVPAILAADATEEQRALAESERVNNEQERVANEIARQAAGERQIRQNLLDNWYFVGGGSQQGGGQFPINQRNRYFIPPNTAYYNDAACTARENTVGDYTEVRYIDETSGELIWSSGNASGKYAKRESMLPGYVKGGYGIDRWRVPAKTVLTLQSNGIRLQTFEAAKQFVQFFENYDVFDGKMLTASILWGDGTLSSGTITYDNSTTGWGEGHTFFTANNAQILMTRNHGFDIFLQSVADVTIAAVKLELGSTQTLAHQENGVWVLNELPNYQQELAKCQRHQLVLGPGTVGGGVSTNDQGTQTALLISTPVTMRATPIASASGTWRVDGWEDGDTVSQIAATVMTDGGVTLIATHPGVAPGYYQLRSANGKIILDANL